MNAKKTILAALLFALALGGYRYDRWRLAEAEAQRVAAIRLLPMTAEAVDRISIERAGLALELRRAEEGWRILRPIESKADEQAVADVIFLLDQQTKSRGERLQPDQLAAVGLASPPIRVAVQSSEPAREFRLEVGEDSPAFGEVYARLAPGGEVFTIASILRDHLGRSLYDFRDKSIVPFDATRATTMTLTVDGHTLEAIRRDGQWRLERPSSLEADDESIESILGTVQMTRAVSFIDTTTLQLARWGLDSPALVATFYAPPEPEDSDGHDPEAGDEPSRATLLIGHRRIGPEPTYFAQIYGSDRLFTVPQELVNALRATVADLRSKQLFTAAAEDVEWIAIDAFRRHVTLRKDSAGLWRFQDDGATKVDQGVVERVIRGLLSVRAERYFEFPPLAEQSGLEAPFLRVHLSDAEGARIEGFISGRTGRRGGRPFVYARRLGQTEVFGLPEDQPGRFMLTREDFQDRTLFFFDGALVARIEIADGQKTLLIEKVDEAWTRSVNGGEQYQVSPGAVRALVLALLGLKWKDALRPEIERDMALIKTQRLEAPGQVIRFLDALGEELAVLGQGGSTESRVYVRRGEDDYFALDIRGYATFGQTLQDLIPRI